MLTAAEIDAMRAAQDGALPEVAVLRRSSVTGDGFGGASSSPQTIAGALSCRVGSPTRQELAMLGDRAREQTAWAVTCPAGTDIRPGDEVVLGTRVLRVASRPHQSWATAARVLAWEVT